MIEKIFRWLSIVGMFVTMLWLLASYGFGAVLGGVALMAASMGYVGCVESERGEDDETQDDGV